MKEWLKRFFSAPQDHETMMRAYESLPLPTGSPEEITQRALIAWRQGDLKRALALYNNAISLRPSDATLYLNRGNLKMELKMIDEAIADLQEAVSREPDIPAWNLELLKMMKAHPALLEGFLKKRKKPQTTPVPTDVHPEEPAKPRPPQTLWEQLKERENASVTRSAAGEIAKKYLVEHPVKGIDGIEAILAHGEPGSREPAFYYPEPIDLDKCWIAYAKPTAHRFGGSHIIIISKETGKVFYSGLDGD